MTCSAHRPSCLRQWHCLSPSPLFACLVGPKDGDLAETSRWSCSPQLGGECTISYDLGEEYSFQELRLGEAVTTGVMQCSCQFSVLRVSRVSLKFPSPGRLRRRLLSICGVFPGSRALPDVHSARTRSHGDPSRRCNLLTGISSCAQISRIPLMTFGDGTNAARKQQIFAVFLFFVAKRAPSSCPRSPQPPT